MDYTLKLDPQTRDIVFDEDGLLATIAGDDATVQNVNVNLNTWMGEFLLDETHGTDYERVLGEPNSFSRSEGEEIVRDSVLQEPKVAIVSGVDVSIDEKRILHAEVAGELASGAEMSTEVIKGGQSK